MKLSLATAFFILVMYLFGPGGILGHNPNLIYDLFGLYMEHEDWYPKNDTMDLTPAAEPKVVVINIEAEKEPVR